MIFYLKAQPPRLFNVVDDFWFSNVTQRDVVASDEDIKKAVDGLAETGFINYFGHQRFGSGCSGEFCSC